MKGRYEVIVRNRRVQYKFTVERNITILRGDSATGKTTLIDMIAQYQLSGDQSGVEVRCDKNCAVLTALNWQKVLEDIHDSIVFIDEGGHNEENKHFVASEDFAALIQHSDNYYVIATRDDLTNLPYSIQEIYGIRNTAGNRYQGTKRLYSEFYPLYQTESETIIQPDLVVTEDSHAGFEFFSHYFGEKGIRCISAEGKSNIVRLLQQEDYTTALIIADGAAFGSEIAMVLALQKAREFMVYMPESFEWVILKSDVLNDKTIRDILADPSAHIASETYFSWERFFAFLLTEQSKGTYLQYSKRKLNPNYLQSTVVEKIKLVMPDI